MDDWFERERLHRAAAAGDLPAVQELVGRGDPVNAFDASGKTPLHHAVSAEHFPVVGWLLRHGADVDAHDERVVGNTPLGDVGDSCTLEMARLLVGAGADPTVPGWMQLTALDRAERRRRRDKAAIVGQRVYELLHEVVRKKIIEANRKKKRR